jgi:hypothetical protein
MDERTSKACNSPKRCATWRAIASRPGRERVEAARRCARSPKSARRWRPSRKPSLSWIRRDLSLDGLDDPRPVWDALGPKPRPRSRSALAVASFSKWSGARRRIWRKLRATRPRSGGSAARSRPASCGARTPPLPAPRWLRGRLGQPRSRPPALGNPPRGSPPALARGPPGR